MKRFGRATIARSTRSTIADGARGASLVDLVVPFDDDTPRDPIVAAMPDVLVKGGDYDAETTAGAAEVIAARRRFVAILFRFTRSTTSPWSASGAPRVAIIPGRPRRDIRQVSMLQHDRAVDARGSTARCPSCARRRP